MLFDQEHSETREGKFIVNSNKRGKILIKTNGTFYVPLTLIFFPVELFGDDASVLSTSLTSNS